MGERFKPQIGGGGTAFPCVPLHLNHWIRYHLASTTFLQNLCGSRSAPWTPLVCVWSDGAGSAVSHLKSLLGLHQQFVSWLTLLWSQSFRSIIPVIKFDKVRWRHRAHAQLQSNFRWIIFIHRSHGRCYTSYRYVHRIKKIRKNVHTQQSSSDQLPTYCINIYIFYSPEMVAAKKRNTKKKKIKKIHKYQKRKHEKPICIVGYFHNIQLSVMFIFIC